LSEEKQKKREFSKKHQQEKLVLSTSLSLFGTVG
jgi:hypothetical protein